MASNKIKTTTKGAVKAMTSSKVRPTTSKTVRQMTNNKVKTMAVNKIKTKLNSKIKTMPIKEIMIMIINHGEATDLIAFLLLSLKSRELRASSQRKLTTHH